MHPRTLPGGWGGALAPVLFPGSGGGAGGGAEGGSAKEGGKLERRRARRTRMMGEREDEARDQEDEVD